MPRGAAAHAVITDAIALETMICISRGSGNLLNSTGESELIPRGGRGRQEGRMLIAMIGMR